uniref:hypothetical protein n=1 Tax=Lysinibacillus sp. Y5S-8 TaxID=3122488 RepID=UPI00403F8BE7
MDNAFWRSVKNGEYYVDLFSIELVLDIEDKKISFVAYIVVKLSSYIDMGEIAAVCCYKLPAYNQLLFSQL